MKKILFLFLGGLLSFHFNLSAQDKADKCTIGKFGIYSSVGTNNVFTFQSLDGAGGYRNDGVFAFGGNYIRNMNQLLDLEIAIEYSKHNVIYTPPFYGDPFQDMTEKKEELLLLSLPVTARVNIGKYFYLNGGILLSFDISKEKMIDNQTGVGDILGLGVKYDFDCGISIYINPYSKVNALIPFSLEKYHQRVWENGIRIGLMCDLRK